LSKADVASVIDTTTAAIIDALKKEKSVIIRGFGTFEVMKAAARIARNHRTGESISVPEKTKMKFRAVSGILE
jgi:nucleoid DNA-binding protein